MKLNFSSACADPSLLTGQALKLGATAACADPSASSGQGVKVGATLAHADLPIRPGDLPVGATSARISRNLCILVH